MSFVDEAAGAAAPGVAMAGRALTRPDLDCDVCVVGASLAGLWLALALGLHGREVVVLDPGEPEALGAGMVVRPGLGMPAAQVLARAGRERAAPLQALAQAAFERAVRLLDVLHVPQIGEGLLYVPGPLGRADLLEEAAARDTLGLPPLVALDRAAVTHALGTHAYFGALKDPRALLFAARSLPAALTEAGRAAGARLMTHTPVLGSDVGGVRKYLQTPYHRIRADHVVFCREAELGVAAPWLERALTFDSFATGALHASSAPPATQSVVEGGERGARLRWDGTRLHLATPTASRAASPAAAACVLRRHARRLYPELGRAVADGARGEVRARSRHGLPLIGTERPGVWHALALGAEPIVAASLAAELIASAIVARDDRIAQFEPAGSTAVSSGWRAPAVPWAGGGRGAAVLGALQGRRTDQLSSYVRYWAGRIRDAAERREAYREGWDGPALPETPGPPQ